MFFRVFIVLALGLFAGCGDLMGPERELAQGFTPCGDFLAPAGQSNTCHPNQYCANPTFSDCEMGCLSNFNCAEDQICAKSPGEDVGSCQNKGAQHQGPTLAAGTTRCGDFMAPPELGYNVCEPNTYCEDATFSRCAAGCQSDVNCPDGEFCQGAEGAATGVCASHP